jgi:hypothetical protein
MAKGPVREESMKGSFGFVAMILGILGIARGGIDSPHANLGQMVGTSGGAASMATLAAVFLLVGGLLILAKSSRVSFGGPRGRANADSDEARLPLPSDARVAKEI